MNNEILAETTLQEKVLKVQKAFALFSEQRTLENAQALSVAEWELCAYVTGRVK